MSRSAWFFLLLAVLAGSPAAEANPPKPYFTDVTDEVGLGGVPVFRIAVADVNGDGYEDLLIHLQPDPATGDVLDKQFLYLNVEGSSPGTRQFVDTTLESGIRADRAGTGGGRHSDAGIFADVDNDGDLDLFTNVYHHRTYTLNQGTNDLLLNDGRGHFSLAPNSPFHTEPIYNTAAEVFVDYDLDGYVDLFIGNWYCPPAGVPDWCEPGLLTDGISYDQLYRGHGDGSFTNVTQSAGLGAAATVVYGIAAFDQDDDGYVDLFAAPYSHTSIYSEPRHWRNNGDGTFTQWQATSNYVANRGFGSNVASFGSMPWDYDNDGDVDFTEVLTHGGSDTGKYSGPVRNDGGVFLWDWSRVVGRDTEDPCTTHDGDHHAAWTDFDGDGLTDYLLTESGYASACGGVNNNRVYLMRQASDHSFSPDTVGSGLDEINDNLWSPGNVIPVDFDRDGDDDVFVGLGGAIGIKLYRNDVGNLDNWISVTLEGLGAACFSNRSALGARLEVTAGSTTWTREVWAGNGHQGPQTPLRQTLGVGTATTLDSIRVRWPNESLTVSELNDVAVNQFLHIREPGDPENLRVDKQGSDLRLSWDESAIAVTGWNVYRDMGPNPNGWGPPHDQNVTDEDPGTPGIQYTDTGAAADPSSYFYLITSVTTCGETPLR